MNDLTWADLLLISLLIISGLAMFGVWAKLLPKRPFPEGLLAYQMDGMVPAFHLAAEFMMAAITIVGAIGWAVGAAWGPVVAVFGLGFFTYSSINSLGWALHNSKSLAIPMIIIPVVAAGTVPYVIATM
jgi:hypothetical protein